MSDPGDESTPRSKHYFISKPPINRDNEHLYWWKYKPYFSIIIQHDKLWNMVEKGHSIVAN